MSESPKNTQKHTPGPWQGRANPNDQGYDTPNVQGPDGNPIANVLNWETRTGDANWSLIAAAPELLEALKGFQRAWDENRLVSSDEAAAIRATIAKAEGRN